MTSITKKIICETQTNVEDAADMTVNMPMNMKNSSYLKYCLNIFFLFHRYSTIIYICVRLHA